MLKKERLTVPMTRVPYDECRTPALRYRLRSPGANDDSNDDSNDDFFLSR